MTNFTKDNKAVVSGGIFVIFTILIAMITFIIFLPIISTILPFLEDMDKSDGRFDNMKSRLNTSIDLFEILPIFAVIIAFIFFIMRTIQKQAYSRYDEHER